MMKYYSFKKVKIMKIKTLILPPLDNNCYIVTKDNNAIIIDPSSSKEKIIKACEPYNVIEILVTHHHFDHVGALKELEDYYHIKHNDFKNTFDYEVIKTPGHSEDSISFYFAKEKVLFSGDFLFCSSIGRVDFPESNPLEMINSLEMIKTYPDDITVYPGHGAKTNLGQEKRHFSNYY